MQRDTPVGSGSVTHPHSHQGGAYKNSCPLHLQKLPSTTPPPCCFPVEWNNLPPSGNPVWVRGPAFSLLLIVCSEEEVKHTIRHRWLSLPDNVLILRWVRSVPFLVLLGKCIPIQSQCETDLYLFDHLTKKRSSFGQLEVRQNWEITVTHVTTNRQTKS